MKLLALLLTVIVASTKAATVSCPASNVVFLIDESETARRKPNFDYLKQSLNTFMQSSLNVRSMGLIGYTGSRSNTNNAQVYLTIGSPAQNAGQAIKQLGLMSPEGSYTDVGMRRVQSRPVAGMENVIIIISGQGSSSRQTNSGQEAARLTQLGWKIFAIGVNQMGHLDRNDLNAATNGDFVVTDSYRNLDIATSYRQRFCNKIVTPPTTRPQPTQAPATVCSECLHDAGFQFDADPEYCDTYYRCIKGGAPLKQHCPAGTFWSQKTPGCDHIKAVDCSMAPCSGAQAGAKYPSGKCCNVYYECVTGDIKEKFCDQGYVFDANTKQCVQSNDPKAQCASEDKFYCRHQIAAAGAPKKCPYAEVFGNPCKINMAGTLINTAPGTIWNKDKCVQELANGYDCSAGITDRDLKISEKSDNCNEVFLATYDNGDTTVTSPRLGRTITVYTQSNNVEMANNAIVFKKGADNPHAYYYYFNSKQIMPDSAFRVRFTLKDFDLNKEYYVLSNSFCEQCPENIAVKVLAPSQNRRVVTATFTRSNNQYQTTADVALQRNEGTLELIVIYGSGELYGQVKEVQSNNPGSTLQTVPLSRQAMPSKPLEGNKCGLMLGNAMNGNAFVGEIDEFAFYESCKNIASILTQQK